MAKSTPGPWHVTAGIVPDPIGRLLVADIHDRTVCLTSTYAAGKQVEVMTANANLIAAAPDLLAALAAAVEWIEDDRFDDEYIMEGWYHAAVAALAKAAGADR